MMATSPVRLSPRIMLTARLMEPNVGQEKLMRYGPDVGARTYTAHRPLCVAPGPAPPLQTVESALPSNIKDILISSRVRV
jgi:hypothetical protein